MKRVGTPVNLKPSYVFIYAKDADNIAIAGEGTIDGNADAFVKRVSQYYVTGDFYPRPTMIYVEHCNHISFNGVTVRNAPFWTLHPAGCAEPIMITTHNRDDDTKSGRISNVQFFNITCDSETGIFLSGSPDNHIEDVLFEHVRIVVRAKSK